MSYCVCGNELLSSIKYKEFFWPTDEIIIVSREKLCSKELISNPLVIRHFVANNVNTHSVFQFASRFLDWRAMQLFQGRLYQESGFPSEWTRKPKCFSRRCDTLHPGGSDPPLIRRQSATSRLFPRVTFPSGTYRWQYHRYVSSKLDRVKIPL